MFQRRQWHPTPVLLPGKSHGWRSLVGYSPWGRWESDTTKRLHFHFSLLCIGEGNGNQFQCSCLENPRDRGAWWAAVYGVAQSWTRLKQLSSSSSSIFSIHIIQIKNLYQGPPTQKWPEDRSDPQERHSWNGHQTLLQGMDQPEGLTHLLHPTIAAVCRCVHHFSPWPPGSSGPAQTAHVSPRCW